MAPLRRRSDPMSVTLRFSYTNRTQSKLLMIVEPWAWEYWIEPNEPVDIEVRGGSHRGQLEIEQTSEGLTICGWEGTLISVVRDGKELPP
jgi:hypothetical protein